MYILKYRYRYYYCKCIEYMQTTVHIYIYISKSILLLHRYNSILYIVYNILYSTISMITDLLEGTQDGVIDPIIHHQASSSSSIEERSINGRPPIIPLPPPPPATTPIHLVVTIFTWPRPFIAAPMDAGQQQ